MQYNYSYPIGSNTKLFTSIAIWQLYKQGKLSVFDSASKYLDPKDLGLSGPWCPRLVNVTSGE
jgi:CubicO group peptidase (beta-lactamase class C family)